MNVYFALNSITFVWEDEKARINPINHDGITFEQEENFIRIISARTATRQERAQYED